MRPSIAVVRRVKSPMTDALVAICVEAALKGGKAKGYKEIGVVFVGDKEMTRLNTTYRGKKKTTDVLSFGEEGIGDLIISIPQVTRQAKTAKKPVRNEIALMLVHGTLHLLGHDHVTLKEEKTMFGLQDRILKKLGYA